MTNLSAQSYLIHYTRRPERLRFMLQQLNLVGISPAVITQFDREDITPDQLYRSYYPNQLDWDRKVKDLWNLNEFRFKLLNPAEISCALKNLEAIRRISVGSAPWGLIIEDDGVITASFVQDLERNLAETPASWDAIFIGDCCNMHAPNLVPGRHAYLKSHPATRATVSYLITKSAAQRVLSTIFPFQLAVDWELAFQFYHHQMQVYWWEPTLVKQGSETGLFRSEIRA